MKIACQNYSVEAPDDFILEGSLVKPGEFPWMVILNLQYHLDSKAIRLLKVQHVSIHVTDSTIRQIVNYSKNPKISFEFFSFFDLKGRLGLLEHNVWCNFQMWWHNHIGSFYIDSGTLLNARTTVGCGSVGRGQQIDSK